MKYQKPNLFCYRLAQAVAWLAATFIFRRKILRNEIKGKKGPFVVIANHECALDFVNLVGLNRHPMSFVISNSFYSTLPIKGFLQKMGVIPKQQFQTSVSDMRRLRAVIDHGAPLVIYPAGLMCEDGLSTPIPPATYKFLKWLNADIYVAKVSGTYFAMPKWAKGLRPGRTYIDVYKLLSKEELAATNLSSLRALTDEALLFDAYREQETLRSKHKSNNIEGLENVLYVCPHCGAEFSMHVKHKNTIYCTACGYAQTSDAYAFFHNRRGIGPELRYVSDWSKLIFAQLKDRIRRGLDNELAAQTRIHMIDPKRNKFVEVGQGLLQLSSSHFQIDGHLHGSSISLSIPIENTPTLPFSPGKYLEIQQGSSIYRCVLHDGRLVMKFINMVKVFYTLRHPELCSSDVSTAV